MLKNCVFVYSMTAALGEQTKNHEKSIKNLNISHVQDLIEIVRDKEFG